MGLIDISVCSYFMKMKGFLKDLKIVYMFEKEWYFFLFIYCLIIYWIWVCIIVKFLEMKIYLGINNLGIIVKLNFEILGK